MQCPLLLSLRSRLRSLTYSARTFSTRSFMEMSGITVAFVAAFAAIRFSTAATPVNLGFATVM